MKQFLKKYFLPLLGGVLLLLLLIYVFIKKPFSGLFNQGIDYNELDDSGAVISDTLATSIAESLHKSMSRWFGTDESYIFDVLTNIRIEDFNKVYNAFGQRPYLEIFGVSTTEYFGENIDLFGWLKYELSPSEFSRLRDLNPLIFR
ncbi:hypothetical protein [Tenacibaculum maritimum]|uniref:hypothetical protein n=1 Tax=Tenacibaculum maritimum TaxID=107401 RepID=UPI0012E4674D|nr:hypothetical protein [Tenacibaculum maritimum]CAA0231116.1 conserved hypothetical protein [Tenacibaculum maritimum]